MTLQQSIESEVEKKLLAIAREDKSLVKISMKTGEYSLRPETKEVIRSALERVARERDKETIEWIMENLYQKYPEACNAFNELFMKHLDSKTNDETNRKQGFR